MKTPPVIFWLMFGISSMCTFPVIAQNFSNQQARQTIKQVQHIIERDYLHKTKAQFLVEKLNRKILLDPFKFNGDLTRFAKQLAAFMRSASGDAHLDIVENITPIDISINKGAKSASNNLNQANLLNFSAVDILPGNIGYIRVKNLYYHDMSKLNIANVFADLSLVDALIIDLTELEGSSYSLVQYMLGFFLPSSTVLGHIETNKGIPNEKLIARQDLDTARFKGDLPIYIINSGFVSGAGEFFSYTLKHFDKAVIIGESTMGIADLVNTIYINDQLSMKLPVKSLINPITESNWEGDGVIPDIPLNMAQSFEKAYQLATSYQN